MERMGRNEDGSECEKGPIIYLALVLKALLSLTTYIPNYLDGGFVISKWAQSVYTYIAVGMDIPGNN
jgi:hypothetical protein